MNNTLLSKVALVTGGSRGIGAAIATRLAQEGADVAFTFQRNAERADDVFEAIKNAGRRALAIQADSADSAAVTGAVERTVAKLGRLDILVNNAGAYQIGEFDALTPAAFEETIAVNVRAPFLAAQAALKHLPSGGRIISIGSMVTDRSAFPGYVLYTMSKSALVGFTRALGRELGPRAITVNLVNPGPTDTELNPADGPYGDVIRSHTALGRFSTPAEVAGAVAFLAGPDATSITGTTITVDGGFIN
jgi:3-oxoacyl-[acyl-carrier protein] reductase